MFERSVPSARTAAAVSSQELSMPRTSITRGPDPGGVGPRPAAAPPGTIGLAGLGGRLGLVEDAGRLQDFDRTLELDVPLHLLRLGEGRGIRLRRRRLLLRRLDHDVRRDALAVDGAALRRVVARGGEPKPRAVRERDDGLDRALPDRRRPSPPPPPGALVRPAPVPHPRARPPVADPAGRPPRHAVLASPAH